MFLRPFQHGYVECIALLVIIWTACEPGQHFPDASKELE